MKLDQHEKGLSFIFHLFVEFLINISGWWAWPTCSNFVELASSDGRPPRVPGPLLTAGPGQMHRIPLVQTGSTRVQGAWAEKWAIWCEHIWALSRESSKTKSKTGSDRSVCVKIKPWTDSDLQLNNILFEATRFSCLGRTLKMSSATTTQMFASDRLSSTVNWLQRPSWIRLLLRHSQLWLAALSFIHNCSEVQV